MKKGQLDHDRRHGGQKDETGTPLVFRDYLINNEITQTDLAYRMGTTVSSISKWERHLCQPTAKNLATLELVLGIPDARTLFPRTWPHLIPDGYKNVQ